MRKLRPEILIGTVILFSGSMAAEARHRADTIVVAQDDDQGAAPDKPAKPHRKLKQPKKAEKRAAKPPAAAPPEPQAPPPAATNLPTKVIVSQKLIEAGAGCIGRTESIAQASLAGAKDFAAAATWHREEPKKHATSVVVGQRDSAGGQALTGIVAAPSTTGGLCEGFTFQVTPTALSCAQLEANVLKSGQALGNLSGVPLLRGPKNQVALLPTADGKACVLVTYRTEY